MNTGQPGRDQESAVTGPQDGVEGQEGDGQPEAPQTFFVGGRNRTMDEIQRDFDASRAEVERWKAVAEERERQRAIPSPQPQAEPLPPWASRYTDLGVPEDVVRQQIAWQTDMAEKMAEAKAAAKVQDLVEGLNQISTAEGQADIAMKQRDSDYDPRRVTEYLAGNPDAKARYDRIYKVSPEDAKYLAWSEISRTAGASGQPRHTQVPSGRRPMQPAKKGADIGELAKRAASGNDDRALADYMKAILGGK